MNVFNPNRNLRLWPGSDLDTATHEEICGSKDSVSPVSCEPDLTTEHIVSSVNSREEYLRIFKLEDEENGSR